MNAGPESEKPPAGKRRGGSSRGRDGKQPSDNLKGARAPHTDIPRVSYFSAYRSQEAKSLRRHSPNALALLHLICERTRYSDNGVNPGGLAVGQSFIGRGDHVECGITPTEYCTALELLKRWAIISTKVIKGRGTIATIINRGIFDPLTAIEMLLGSKGTTTRFKRDN